MSRFQELAKHLFAVTKPNTVELQAFDHFDLDMVSKCVYKLAQNPKQGVALLRILLSELEDTLPRNKDFVSVMSSRRIFNNVCGFLSPSEVFGVLPLVSRYIAIDLKNYFGHLIPFYSKRMKRPIPFVRNMNVKEESNVINVNSFYEEDIGDNENSSGEDQYEIVIGSNGGNLNDGSETEDDLASGNSKTHFFKSEIECGVISESGELLYSIHSDYFGREVDVFTAVEDPQKRVLFRASALAAKLGCKTNKVGMYLARRRDFQDDIYQATIFRRKPIGATGLKSGGYFITLDGCKKYEEHFEKAGNKPFSIATKKRRVDGAEDGHYDQNPQDGTTVRQESLDSWNSSADQRNPSSADQPSQNQSQNQQTMNSSALNTLASSVAFLSDGDLATAKDTSTLSNSNEKVAPVAKPQQANIHQNPAQYSAAQMYPRNAQKGVVYPEAPVSGNTPYGVSAAHPHGFQYNGVPMTYQQIQYSSQNPQYAHPHAQEYYYSVPMPSAQGVQYPYPNAQNPQMMQRVVPQPQGTQGYVQYPSNPSQQPISRQYPQIPYQYQQIRNPPVSVMPQGAQVPNSAVQKPVQVQQYRQGGVPEQPQRYEGDQSMYRQIASSQQGFSRSPQHSQALTQQQRQMLQQQYQQQQQHLQQQALQQQALQQQQYQQQQQQQQQLQQHQQQLQQQQQQQALQQQQQQLQQQQQQELQQQQQMMYLSRTKNISEEKANNSESS
jgi:hypothetical protein